MAGGVSSFWAKLRVLVLDCEFFNTILIAPGILLALIGFVNSLRQLLLVSRFKHDALYWQLLYHAILQLLYYIVTEDRSAKRLAKLYVASLVNGSLFWLVDHLFCKDISRWYFNPQGHAVWHIS